MNTASNLMGAIVQITKFQTTDGREFDHFGKAKKHQAFLDLKQLMEDYRAGRPGGIGIPGVFDLLDNHGDMFREYLELKEGEDRNIRKGTIKDFAVQVLSDFPNGLVALDILEKINERFGTDFPRTSLSPQLSRLKEEGVIDRRGMVWYLAVNNDKGPEDESGPNVGSVAERSNAPD